MPSQPTEPTLPPSPRPSLDPFSPAYEEMLYTGICDLTNPDALELMHVLSGEFRMLEAVARHVMDLPQYDFVDEPKSDGKRKGGDKTRGGGKRRGRVPSWEGLSKMFVPHYTRQEWSYYHSRNRAKVTARVIVLKANRASAAAAAVAAAAAS